MDVPRRDRRPRPLAALRRPAGRCPTARLARLCVRRHRLVMAAWLVLVVAGLGAVGPVLGRLDRQAWSVAPHESVRGSRLLEDSRPYGGQVDAVVAGVAVSDPRLRRELAAVRRDLGGIGGVQGVSVPATAVGPAPAPVPAPAPGGAVRGDPDVAADGRAALVTVRFARGLTDAARQRSEAAAEARLRRIADAVPGSGVTLGGNDRARRAVAARSVADTRRSELITLPVTLVAVYLLFGGLAAASVPLLAAVSTVVTGMGWLLLLSRWYDVTSPALSTTTMIGLGLAVDYSLMMVGRFREERAAGQPVEEAVVRMMGSAGRSVGFAALVVASALCGLAAFPSDFYAAIGLAAAGTVALSLAAALTLTPALLAAFPHRIGAAGERAAGAGGGSGGVAARLARWTRRHALPAALGVGVLLLACAAPFLRVHLVSPVGEQQLPPGAEARRYADLVAARFPQHRADAVVVVARTGPAGLQAWADRFGDLPQVQEVGRATAAAPGLAVVRVVPAAARAGDGDPPAERLVHRLREARPAGFPAWVTGRSAVDVDFRAEVAEHAPRAAALIGLTTCVLLFLMTGSVLLPLKAVAMNTLSLGASFGALVLVFQDGWAAGLLGVHTLGGLGYWLPVVVFALAFGLSMDYEVFLLCRIQELYDAGVGNDRAVELGLQRSARIISSSAALMCVVFIGFATGELTVVKQLSVALAVVVVVDATLVRCLLVPATMTLLRDVNWWGPRALRRRAVAGPPSVRPPGPAPEEAAPAGSPTGQRVDTAGGIRRSTAGQHLAPHP
ncbi:MMPL family transporter [Streptomyces sp. NPDC046866]|uniref:MMPL family transporter n=1 Tax=Streptomyces sp. NPDC046866 TaxID=3154921 RepID=UPI0034535B35